MKSHFFDEHGGILLPCSKKLKPSLDDIKNTRDPLYLL